MMSDFSFQLYSARNFPPLSATLAMLKAEGYVSVEGYGGLFPADDGAAVPALKQALDAAGLIMPTAHIGLDLLERDPGRVLAIADHLGLEAVYCPHLDAAERPADADGWAAFARRLTAAGAPLWAAGIGFGWHNHDFEFRPLPDGQIPLAVLLDTAPALSWEADIAWIVRGGADPFVWIDRYGDRITAVHVKDIAPAGRNVAEDGWADVGDGVVDWRALAEALKALPIRHFVMEHDNPSDATRFARRSLAAARRLQAA